jgi:nickel/cobalt transporter (NiCoT) family protein
MTIALAVAATSMRSAMPEFERYGTIIGASISGLFLWLIGILNLLVLIEIWRIWRLMQQGTYRPERLEELLSQRGLASRLLAAACRA